MESTSSSARPVELPAGRRMAKAAMLGGLISPPGDDPRPADCIGPVISRDFETGLPEQCLPDVLTRHDQVGVRPVVVFQCTVRLDDDTGLGNQMVNTKPLLGGLHPDIRQRYPKLRCEKAVTAQRFQRALGPRVGILHSPERRRYSRISGHVADDIEQDVALYARPERCVCGDQAGDRTLMTCDIYS